MSKLKTSRALKFRQRTLSLRCLFAFASFDVCLGMSNASVRIHQADLRNKTSQLANGSDGDVFHRCAGSSS